jgi:hypothetical protein
MIKLAFQAVVLCTVAPGLHAAQAHGACTSTYLGDWFPSTFDPGQFGVGIVAALDASGARIAIGCPGHLQMGQETGAACVIDLTGATPVREDLVAPPSAPSTAYFGGSSIALDSRGETLAVGAPAIGGGALGRAFVYRRTAGQWNLDGQFVGIASDSFGYQVALSGDGLRLVVSAPNRSSGGFTGLVFIYERLSTGWALERTVSGSDTMAWGGYGVAVFGNALALSRDGKVLALRSFASPNEPVPSGAVFMMRDTDVGWVIEKRLQEPVAYTNCCFGSSLALDARGDTLVAGNYADPRAGVTQAGAASIFRYGPNGWAFEAALTSNDPHPNGFFGRSVAINDAGDRLLVGASNHVNNGVMSGAAEEFVATPAGWSFVARHHARVPESGAGFGRSLAMNATGSRWVAGEPTVDLYGTNRGRLHLFEANCMEPEVYCRSQRNTLGCAARISAQGSPSVSSANGFLITAGNVRNQQNGMLLYGANGRAELPWLGGMLCVRPPLRRTPLSNSGGSSAPANNCSGALSIDFNTWASTSTDPDLFAGQHVRAQFYSRDPGAPANLNLSDAIEFYLEP